MLNTPLLLFAALALAVLGALRGWPCGAGRASKVDLLGGLLAMPRRYLVDLHHVVARDKYMSNTHVATAGGFVLAACWRSWCTASACITASSATPCWCHGADVRRRAVRLRRRQPAVAACPKARGCACRKAAGVLGELFPGDLPVAGILPEGFGGWVLAALLGVGAGACELFFGMTWGGPMKHAFAGALHLAWHRRAERRRPFHRPQSRWT
jgi:hypothetical protein